MGVNKVTINTDTGDALILSELIGDRQISGSFVITPPLTVDYGIGLTYYVDGNRIVVGSSGSVPFTIDGVFNIYGDNAGNITSTLPAVPSMVLATVVVSGGAIVSVTEENIADGTVGVVKNNLSATIPPSITDDAGLNYSVGSRWIISSSSDEFVCTDNTIGAAVWVNTTAASVASKSMQFALHKPSGNVPVLGVLVNDNSGLSINAGSPQTLTNMNRFHVVFNVTSMINPGQILLTGNSYDKATGAMTVGDTEIVTINSTGWYKSAKYWNDSVVAIGQAGGNFIVDQYRYDGVDFSGVWDVSQIYTIWDPSNNSNQITATLYKVNFTLKTRVAMQSFSYANTQKNKDALFIKTYTAGVKRFDFDSGDKMIFAVESATNIRNFNFQIKMTEV